MISRRIVKAEISFVNLIDVTLVLLIIFMITAPAMNDMIQVDLPAGKASRANITDGILITVDRKGAIMIDRETIPAGEFETRFAELWQKRHGEPVYVRGDENALYGHIMNVISAVKETGGENVGLVVEDRPRVKKK
ncbi:MAG: biopolymer transporter ExbD [Candidatus Latescibacteria bacterium]|nr:biopolymer transporter ExbD [Candidatus Latescibacterota bacterium]